MKKNKQLMIIERTESLLTECAGSGQDGVIRLSGVFTKFNVLNGNNRIYTPEGFLPKLQELMPAINSGALLGELDHPKTFDVSLQNASHVIEKVEYDEANQQVIGTIRLLNTDAGRQAQALVRDGIPLHISSRAAGNVDPATNKVTLDKLFTYDLVATPGFSEAVLHRVNESYGFSNSGNIAIYEMDELNEAGNNKEYNNTIMSSNNMDNHVTTKDFQKYTEYIGGVVGQLKESLENVKAELKKGSSALPEKLESYLDHLAEGINKTQEHSDYLAEQLERTINDGGSTSSLEEKVNALIKHNNYLAEQLEKTIKYSEYVAENLNTTQRHNDYLAEQLEKTANHSDYLAEQLEKGIGYSEYVAENLDNAVKHNDYLVDNLNAMCQHSDYVVESMNKMCEHQDYLAEKLEQNFAHNDYLAEKLEQNFAHNDYIAEELNKSNAYSAYIAESLDKTCQHNDYLAEQLEATANHSDYLAEQLENGINGKAINEGWSSRRPSMVIEGKTNDSYKANLDAKLDALIAKVNENVKEENFMNFLSENRQKEFNSLDDDTKGMITEAMKGVKNAEQATAVWRRVYESKKGLDIVENMPEQFRAKWESLSDQRKGELLEEAKFYKLNTANEIAYFWQTRDLRETKQVVERLDTDSARMWNTEANLKEQNDYIGSVMGQVKRRMGGF